MLSGRAPELLQRVRSVGRAHWAQVLGSWAKFSGSTVDDRSFRVLVARRCLILWSWWVLASVVGGTLTSIVSRLSATAVGTIPSLVIGILPLAIAQALVLRRYLPKGPWVFASAAALLVGLSTWLFINSWIRIASVMTKIGSAEDFEVLGVLVDAQLFWQRTLGFFVVWGVVGAGQWLVLRQYIEHTGLWVIGSALAGAASGIALVVVGSASDDLLLPWAARWMAYGALSGFVLVWLLRDRIKRNFRTTMDPTSDTSAN